MPQPENISNTWTQADPENEVRYAYGVTQWINYSWRNPFELSEEAKTALYRQDEAPVYFLKARGMTGLPRWISGDPNGERTEGQSDETDNKNKDNKDKEQGDDETPQHGYRFG